MKPSRRWILASMGAGAAVIAGLGWRRWRTEVPADADAVAHALTQMPTEAVALTVAGWLAAGLPAKVVLDAAFHAPLVYHCDEGDIHASLVAVAIYNLARGTPHLDVMACWAAEFTAQWLLSPTLEAPPVRPAQLPIDMAVQLGPDWARDSARASTPEQIQAALIRHAGLTRPDPHAAIFIAQVLRGLECFGPRHAHRVLTSAATRLSRIDETTRNRYIALSVPSGGIEPEGVFEPIKAGTLRMAFWSPALGMVLRARARQKMSLQTLQGGVCGAALDALSIDQAVSGDGVHALILMDACVEIARHVKRPDVAARLFLSAALCLHDRRAALKGTPRPTPPSFDVGRQAQAMACAHLEDPHYILLAQAIRTLRTQSWRPYDFDERVSQASLFKAVGHWKNRSAVEARLRG